MPFAQVLLHGTFFQLQIVIDEQKQEQERKKNSGEKKLGSKSKIKNVNKTFYLSLHFTLVLCFAPYISSSCLHI